MIRTLALTALAISAPILCAMAGTSAAKAQGYGYGGGYSAPSYRHAPTYRAHRQHRPQPYYRPSSPAYPGGRCGQLNAERARLYGLC